MNKNLLKMNLQIFAESEQLENASEEVENKQQEVQSEQSDPELRSFTQDELNSILAKEKAKMQKAMDEKVSEAQKLAKMTADQKAEYEQKQREESLKRREADITKRELMAEAKNMLVEKKLPVSLAGVLNYTDADSCQESIEAVETAFQEAVETIVHERLRGGEPMKKAPDTQTVTKEEFTKMGYTERLKLKTEKPEVYKELSGK